MKKTRIEWCDATVNTVVGCTFVCPYCYAKRLNTRFHFIKNWNEPQFFPERLKQLESKTPQNIFMNSMSDIADWPALCKAAVFAAIHNNPQHNYLFLTKRPEELKAFSRDDKIWLGVTVTKYCDVHRLHTLTSLDFINKFVCFEPLLNELDFIPEDVKWIIIGAETGNRHGKVIPKAKWVESIVHRARQYSIPVFMKDSLVPIMGETNMLREFPKELIR